MSDTAIRAIDHVLVAEGGDRYTNHPADKGGPTKFGITQSVLSAWRGGRVSAEDVKQLQKDEALAIYKARYWDQMGLDLIDLYPVALCIMDQGVNRGTKTAVRQAQMVANQMGSNLSVDGVMGPKTKAAIESYHPLVFCREYLQFSQQAYNDIVLRNSSQSVFLKGWTNRVHRLQDLVLIPGQEVAAPIEPVPQPVEEKEEFSLTPYEWAIREIGVREVAGSKHNPRILYYHSFTSLGAKDDETAWCSSFVNAAHAVCGLPYTESAAARSWLNYGVQGTGKKGDIVILWRGSKDGWQGHVGFLHEDYKPGDSHLSILGGNQGNEVDVSTYPASRLLGFRRAF